MCEHRFGGQRYEADVTLIGAFESMREFAADTLLTVMSSAVGHWIGTTAHAWFHVHFRVKALHVTEEAHRI